MNGWTGEVRNAVSLSNYNTTSTVKQNTMCPNSGAAYLGRPNLCSVQRQQLQRHFLWPCQPLVNGMIQFDCIQMQSTYVKHLKVVTFLHFHHLLSSWPQATWPAEPSSAGNHASKPASKRVYHYVRSCLNILIATMLGNNYWHAKNKGI